MRTMFECVVCGLTTPIDKYGRYYCKCSTGAFKCSFCETLVAEEGDICKDTLFCNLAAVKKAIRQQDWMQAPKNFIRVTNVNNILPTEDKVIKALLGKITEDQPLEIIFGQSVYVLDNHFSVVSKKRDFLVDGNREMIKDKMVQTVVQSFFEKIFFGKPELTHVKGWLTWTKNKVSFKNVRCPEHKTWAKQKGVVFCKNGKVRAWIKGGEQHGRESCPSFKTVSFIATCDKNFSNKGEPLYTELFYGAAVYQLEKNRRKFGTNIQSYEWDLEALFNGKTEKDSIWEKNKLGKAWAIHPILRELDIHIPEVFPGKHIASLGDYCELVFGSKSKGFRKLALSHRGKANLTFLKIVQKAHPNSGFEYWEKALNNPTVDYKESFYTIDCREIYSGLVLRLSPTFSWDSGSDMLWKDSYQGLKEIESYCNVYDLEDPFYIEDQRPLNEKELAKQALLKEVYAKLKTFSTIQGVHDYLSMTYLEKCIYGENQTPYHTSLEYSHSKISFRTPRTVGEVVLWGKKQHHCIANYGTDRDCILLQVEIPGEDVSHAQVQVIKSTETNEKGELETVVTVKIKQMFKANNNQVPRQHKSLLIEHLKPIVNANGKYVTIDNTETRYRDKY